MSNNQLSTKRINWQKPDHNLWSNNGTWWIKYVVHTPDHQKITIRHSLKTHDVGVARRARDAVFAPYLPMTPDNKNSPVKLEPSDFLEWMWEKCTKDPSQPKTTTAGSGSTKKETYIEDCTEEFLATFGKGGKSGFQFFNTHGPSE